MEVHAAQPTPYQYTSTETTFSTVSSEPKAPTEAPEEDKSEETPDNVIRFSGF